MFIYFFCNGSLDIFMLINIDDNEQKILIDVDCMQFLISSEMSVQKALIIS